MRTPLTCGSSTMDCSGSGNVTGFQVLPPSVLLRISGPLPKLGLFSTS